MGKGNKSCNIVLIWASIGEARYFLDALNVSENEILLIDKLRLVNIISGPGAKNAFSSCGEAIRKYRPNLIISSGSCALLSNNKKAGDIMITSSVIDLNDNVIYKPDNLFNNRTLSLSGNLVITTTEMRKKLHNEYGAVSFDWESGAIAKKCFDEKIRFNSIRAVTDTGKHNFKIEYRENLTFAMKRLSRFFCKIIRKIGT